jgi:hypothetical protein
VNGYIISDKTFYQIEGVSYLFGRAIWTGLNIKIHIISTKIKEHNSLCKKYMSDEAVLLPK